MRIFRRWFTKLVSDGFDDGIEIPRFNELLKSGRCIIPAPVGSEAIDSANKLLYKLIQPLDRIHLSCMNLKFYKQLENINTSALIPNQQTFEYSIIYSLLHNDSESVRKNIESMQLAGFRVSKELLVCYFDLTILRNELECAIQTLESFQQSEIRPSRLVRLFNLLISQDRIGLIPKFSKELYRLEYIGIHIESNRQSNSKAFSSSNQMQDENTMQENANNSSGNPSSEASENQPVAIIYNKKLNRLVKKKLAVNDDYVALHMFNWMCLVGLKVSPVAFQVFNDRLKAVGKQFMVCDPASDNFGSTMMPTKLLGPFGCQ